MQSRWRTSLPPAFGVPDRDARMNAFFRREHLSQAYRPLYDVARQVAGTTTSPYLAAVRLEDWFRAGGGFSYDASPPSQDKLPTLVHFVTRSRSRYCQHASAMALMLRYLGVPSRVAAGFTSGTYDQKTREWTVTDHEAHTWVEVWFRGFGWLPFDPTPGRGTLDGSYSAASNRFDPATLGARSRPRRRGQEAGRRRPRPARTARHDSARDVPGDVATTTQKDASLFRLLVLLALGLLAAVAVAKQAWRHARFLTRDPRRTAAACRRELADFLADQRFVVPPSATVAELGEIARHELGVNPEPFVSAVGAARYDRPERAGPRPAPPAASSDACGTTSVGGSRASSARAAWSRCGPSAWRSRGSTGAILRAPGARSRGAPRRPQSHPCN